MPLGVISVVASVNNVSDGGVFWKTTPAMDDLPLLDFHQRDSQCELWIFLPSIAHEDKSLVPATTGAVYHATSVVLVSIYYLVL